MMRQLQMLQVVNTLEDEPIVVSLSADDIDGDVLSYELLDADATNGNITLDGSIATYTPDADFNGSDSFTFTIK